MFTINDVIALSTFLDNCGQTQTFIYLFTDNRNRAIISLIRY